MPLGRVSGHSPSVRTSPTCVLCPSKSSTSFIIRRSDCPINWTGSVLWNRQADQRLRRPCSRQSHVRHSDQNSASFTRSSLRRTTLRVLLIFHCLRRRSNPGCRGGTVKAGCNQSFGGLQSLRYGRSSVAILSSWSSSTHFSPGQSLL